MRRHGGVELDIVVTAMDQRVVIVTAERVEGRVLEHSQDAEGGAAKPSSSSAWLEGFAESQGTGTESENET